MPVKVGPFQFELVSSVESTLLTLFTYCTSGQWMDGFLLWSMGVNPLEGLFTGLESLHEATKCDASG